MKLKLKQTCSMCPEQYDAYTPDGLRIGYLRLRHGSFTVDYTPTDEQVYSACPKGDGVFECDERNFFLGEACDALIKKHKQMEDKIVKDTFYIENPNFEE